MFPLKAAPEKNRKMQQKYWALKMTGTLDTVIMIDREVDEFKAHILFGFDIRSLVLVNR